MKKPRHCLRACLLLCCAAIVPAVANAEDVTAISSRTTDDYVRVKLPDGSIQLETYAFGEGGHSSSVSDASIDGLRFIDVARAIAGPLAKQRYIPTRDAKTTKLLVLVYWGRTSAPGRPDQSVATQESQSAAATLGDIKSSNAAKISSEDGKLDVGGGMPCGKFEPNISVMQAVDEIGASNALNGAMATVSAENRSRDHVTAHNAALLGYDSLWASTAALKGTPLEYRRQDLINELEESRYYVVLMAYDFQMLWKEKKHKLLWETRVSIRQRQHDFDRELVAMAQHASKFFGRDSNGVVREAIPEGRVDIGDVKVVEAGPVK